MGLALHRITAENYELFCSKPTYKRETILFAAEKSLHLQIYNSISEQSKKVQALKASKKQAPKEVVNYYLNKEQVIDDNKQLIQEHVDKRIQLFFQQTILCYDTPFKFSYGGAENQFGVGANLKSRGKNYHQTQAAHASVLPCIYAMPISPNGNVDESNKFVYLKHSHAYDQQNSTDELPISANQSDTFIDGKIGENKLRDRSIKIINSVAQAKLTPRKATEIFLKIFKKEVKKAISALPKSDLRVRVLKIYLEQVRDVQAELRERSDFFDSLMTVKISDSDEVLRNVVYKNRFTLLQNSECIHTRMIKKISKVQNEISGSTSNAVKKIDYRMRISLLQMANEDQRTYLEKLFCTSLSQLTSHANKADSAKMLKRVESYKRTNGEKLAGLIASLNKYFIRLESIEFTYRATLFKGLRVEYKDWTQKELVKEYKEKYDDSFSTAMVSRFEQLTRKPTKKVYQTPLNQRQKLLTIDKAKKIADVFAVDKGLFIAGLME
ncbi:MAG: hypothetical protein VX777_04425 [Chlamydiota bacterium]|nr:hypothetical protein [Chlamydiota bacterium]